MAVTPRIFMQRVNPAGDEGSFRQVNDNFLVLQRTLEQAMADGTIIGDGSIGESELTTLAKTLIGDVTGTIGSTGSTTVVKIQGKAIAAPVAGDDGKAITYDNAGGALAWTALFTDPLTTRGDLLVRDAVSSDRLPIGAANSVLASDGTDAAWDTLTALLDGAIGSTRGSVLYRGASGWAILAPDTAGKVLTDGGVGADPSWAAAAGGSLPSGVQGDILYHSGSAWVVLNAGTSGHFLKTQGAAANPLWAAASAASPLTTKGDLYGYDTADARIPIGTDGQVLTADSAQTLGLKWAAASGGGSTNWWDDPKCNIISHAVLHDGDILNPLGEPIALLTGGVDGDGYVGAGGFTETTVACTCVYDISPSINTARGYNWFDQDIPMQTGQYFRTSVRFPTKDDQTLFVGFGESSIFNDGGVIVGGEAVGILLRGGTDTNWQVIHNDGSTGQTLVDTGRAWGTNDWLNVEIYIWDTGGGTMNAKVWINGTLEATITTNLPAATTITCRPFIQTWFQSTGATATYDQVIFVNHGFWASYDAGELETNGWATL